MAITPGDDIETKTSEPLPRGSWFDRAGKITREVINYFNGKDRLAGEIVSGINRNRQNIVQLETDYQGADGALSASISSVADVASDNTTAIATVSNEVEAARDGEASLSAKITDIDQAIVDEAGVRATADSAVLATTRSESQRPNLVPAHQQMILGGQTPDLTSRLDIFSGSFVTTGNAHAFLSGTDPATGTSFAPLRYDRTGSGSVAIRPKRDQGSDFMYLEPGRYAYKVAVTGFTSIDSYKFQIRDSSTSIIYDSGDVARTVIGFEVVEGYFDIESADGGPFIWQFYGTFNATGFGLLHRLQVTRIPDGTTDAGDWSGSMDSVTALTNILQDAFIGSDGLPVATIRLVAAASGSDPAEIELLSSDGVSSVVITGDTFIDGDLMVSGSIVTDGLASNAVTNSQVSQTVGSISLSNDTWTTVASFSFTSVGIGVELRGTCTINNTASIGSSLGTHEWRLRRDSTTLKSGEGTLASTDDGFVQYRTSHIVADYNDIPSAGTYTYTLQVKIGTTTGAVNSRTVTNRYLSAREFKR